MRSVLILTAVLAALSVTAVAQGVPDVIVGDLHAVANYTDSANIDAFSIGTTSCNIGNAPLAWVSNTNQHPVIGQTAFRLLNDRFEQIGQSWLKHGFFALAGSECDPCNGNSGSALQPQCSDPYGAGLNGDQTGLGPKWQVNASTGFFPFPYAEGNQGVTGDDRYKRLQIGKANLDPAQNPGALYFVEGQYVHPEEPILDLHHNNASWREVTFSGSGMGAYSISFASGSMTMREEPAIFAWKFHDPSVTLVSVDDANDGRFWVGFKATAVGGGVVEYEYAVHNLNSDRSAGSFSVPMPAGATVTNIGFHDVAYHSGEPWDGTDWSGSYGGSDVSWATTPHATDPNANAIRWGTLYNFRFRSDMGPTGDPVIGLFKPGVPSSITVPLAPPAFDVSITGTPPTLVSNATPTDVDFTVTDLSGSHDPATVAAFVSVDGGAYSSAPVTNQGGGSYRFTLPAIDCRGSLNWYVQSDEMGGGNLVTNPAGAPLVNYATSVDLTTINFAQLSYDDMEVDNGWTVVDSGTLTDGSWDRGIPIGLGDRLDPAVDFDGSGSCWLTDNVDGNSDVDGGTTSLITPTFSLFDLPDAVVAFAFWYDESAGNADDFEIEISNDAGGSWVSVETVQNGQGSWQTREYFVADHLTPTDLMQMRFTAADEGSQAVIEAGLDAFETKSCPILNDATARGTVGFPNDGGPEDVLLINGSAGGALRRVVVDINDPVTFQLNTPAHYAFNAPYVLWGRLNSPPTIADEFALPFSIGTMSFPPCLADANNALLFEFADSFDPMTNTGPCAPLVPGATPTPWALGVGGGFPIELELTLQGIIFSPNNPVNLGITNAVHFKVVTGAP